jgi:hypothetical protein
MSSSLTCIRCQSLMEEGVSIDHGHANMLAVSEWLEGPPERTFWSGLKTKGRDKFSVRTFRCTRCGYLESYANP